MLTKLQNIFSIPELKKRLLFTAGLLIVYRLGGHVPTPGIDGGALKSYFAQNQGTLFGLYDMFVGGAFERATVFALGIMPYISASIIIQLFGAVIPYFEKLQKEGEEGRKKITQLTRYGTVLLAGIQAIGIGIFLQNLNGQGLTVVPNPGTGFLLMTMLTLTAGTIFVMWLGEQITERGIGNGISLVITVGIIAQYPNDILNTLRAWTAGQFNIFELVVLGLVLAAVIVLVVLMTLGVRKIPVQYAKRVVGRKMYGGQSTHIPLRVNTAGVMPIIFAQSIIAFPGTLAALFPNSDLMAGIQSLFSPGAPIYIAIYGLMIVFFTYFYTAIVLNPVDLADNMRKYGGFIPGIRPGKKTAEYIDKVLTRITLPGSIFLAFIAILPDIMIRQFNVPFYFGGTGLLIVVGVMLDTMAQIESHLHMRHYEGFMKSGKMKTRSAR
jgi:preprotein translocase subunit SecY